MDRIESFNVKLKDERHKAERFFSLGDLRYKSHTRITGYNE